MSIARKAAKGGLWLAGFRSAAQIFSWIITIIIARMLAPEDYGLIAMASILTGYMEMFSELGLGSAIIQKKEIRQGELSSIFWFSIIAGTLFALVGFALAYPTALIFNEPRVIPITQAISVLFIISGLLTVPNHLLTREVRFKEIGIIQFVAVILASLPMFLMASKGFGVWTLVYGYIIQLSTNGILVYLVSGWRPGIHFCFREVRPFLKFGLSVAGSRSLLYLFQKVDLLIVGKLFSVEALGYYSLVMSLARSPSDKILSLTHLVSFPVVSRYQEDLGKCRHLYLKITKYIAIMVTPLFIGGAIWGEEIIPALLGEKWAPIAFLFRALCIAYLIVSISLMNSVVNTSIGFPGRVFTFQLINTFIMPISIFVAAGYGFNALAIPWITVFPVTYIIWTLITLKKVNIFVTEYISCILTPLLGTLFMLVGIYCFQFILNIFMSLVGEFKITVWQVIVLGAVLYMTYISIFDRSALNEIRSIWKA